MAMLDFYSSTKEKIIQFILDYFIGLFGITIGFGLENVKLEAQYGYSINTNNRDFRQINNYFVIGATVRF